MQGTREAQAKNPGGTHRLHSPSPKGRALQTGLACSRGKVDDHHPVPFTGDLRQPNIPPPSTIHWWSPSARHSCLVRRDPSKRGKESFNHGAGTAGDPHGLIPHHTQKLTRTGPKRDFPGRPVVRNPPCSERCRGSAAATTIPHTGDTTPTHHSWRAAPAPQLRPKAAINKQTNLKIRPQTQI